MPEWPVTIRTPDGDIVEVDFTPSGRVYLFTSYQGTWLDGPQFEELSRALIAARWAAEGRVAPPLGTGPARSPTGRAGQDAAGPIGPHEGPAAFHIR